MTTTKNKNGLEWCPPFREVCLALLVLTKAVPAYTPPAVNSGHSDNQINDLGIVERKLKELKMLYEKGLLSKETYDEMQRQVVLKGAGK